MTGQHDCARTGFRRAGFRRPGAALAVVLTSAVLQFGCTSVEAEPGSIAGRWTAQVDTLADTVTIRTISGSEWGAARLVEELRIGAVDGPDHLMFGRVGAVATRSNGEILVLDQQANALRRFGADGSYLGTISRAGSGPGEYRGVAGLAVLADDRLVMHDFGNHRFNIYDADTTFLTTWLLNTQVAEWRPVHTHDGGSVYLYDRVLLGDATERTGVLVRLDEQGVPGDTTIIRLVDRETPSLQLRSATQSIGMAIPFHPTADWSVTDAGDLVTFDGARYAIDIHRRDGTVLRLSRAALPVPVTAGERAAEEARITARFRQFSPTWSWDGEPIPDTKPPIDWLHTAQDGAIWVRVAQPGTPLPDSARVKGARSFIREPIVFDVFESDGRYRGQVHAPDGFQLAPHPILGADKVWAVIQDENGVNFVVRFGIARG